MCPTKTFHTMTITIYREHGRFRLIPERLAHRLRVDGVVAFVSGREHQREIARMVMAAVRPDYTVVSGETQSPNWCMCIVDLERYRLSEVLSQVGEADTAYENSQGGQSF